MGYICPYCQTPIQPGQPVRYCPACQTPHHTACWQQRGGCSAQACQGKEIQYPDGYGLDPTEYYDERERERRRKKAKIMKQVGTFLGAMGVFLVSSLRYHRNPFWAFGGLFLLTVALILWIFRPGYDY